MKCPNCETQMVKGVMTKGGWYGETFAKLNKFAVETFNFGRFVSAYRCPKCGKVELYTDPD